MNKQELRKLFEQEKIKKYEEMQKALFDIKESLKKHDQKTLKEPLKSAILNDLKNILPEKYHLYYNSYNNLVVYTELNFKYYDTRKIENYLSDYSIDFLLNNLENFSFCDYLPAFKMDYQITFNDKKINDNNIDEIIKNIAQEKESIKIMLKTFEKDLKKLEELREKVLENINLFNSYDFNIRKIFDEKYHLSLYNDLNYNITTEKESFYKKYDGSIDFKQLLTVLKTSVFFNNNHERLYKIDLEKDNLIFNFFNYSSVNDFIVNIKDYVIVKNNYDDIKFSSFDNLYKYIDNYEELEKKAKRKMLFLKNKPGLTISKNFNFNDESCFISSNDLHGFYFPNIEIKYQDELNHQYNFIALAFIDSICYGVFENEENDEIIIL